MTVKRIAQVICLVSLGLSAVACRAAPTPAPGLATDLSAERAKVECRQPGEAAQEVSVGQHEPVGTGDEINTDDNGLGILTFADFLRVEVFRETGLQVKAAPDPDAPPIVKLYLALGTTLQELQKRAGERVEVTTETDWATIRAVSTVYLVSVDDDKVTAVVVFYGEAEVEAQGQTVVVRTGQATLVEPGKAPRPPVDADMGAVDDWVAGARQAEEVGSIKPVIFPTVATPTSTSTPTATPTPTLIPTMMPTYTPTSTPTVTPTPKPADVRLISELEISNLSPLVGESVKAIFRVRNYGEQTFTAAKFLVKGRGPDDSIQDFRPIDNFSLAPGAEYTYSEYRTFSAPGQYWFTPHYSPDGANWLDITWPDGRASYLYITVWTPTTPTATPTNTPTPTPCVVQPPIGWQQYTVQRGDTLYSLAVSRGTTVQEVRRVNCLPDDVIEVGQVLWLPAPHTPTSTPTPINTPTPTNTPINTPTITPTSTPTSPPADVRLTSDLQLSNLSPLVGESVNATFKALNYGGQTFTARYFGVKGRGPNGSIQDFLMIENFSLAPGAEYTYSSSRSFSAPGEYWFTPHYSPDGTKRWLDITWPDGRTSYRYIIIQDNPPVVEGIYVEPSIVYLGEEFWIWMEASDDLGLQSIWWWSKGTGDDYLDKGDYYSCGGATRCEGTWDREWTGKVGEFPIYAQARDTAGQLSSIESTTIWATTSSALLLGVPNISQMVSAGGVLGFGFLLGLLLITDRPGWLTRRWGR